MPRLRPTGGIFWRLDSSGNLTAYDPSNTTLGKFIGGVFYSKQNVATVSSTASGTVTSTSFVSLGFALSITPQFSGRILLFFSEIASPSATYSINVTLQRDLFANGVPAFNAGVAGTSTALTPPALQLGANTFNINVTGTVLDVGLTVGTNYIYYPSAAVATGQSTIFGGTAKSFITGIEL